MKKIIFSLAFVLLLTSCSRRLRHEPSFGGSWNANSSLPKNIEENRNESEYIPCAQTLVQPYPQDKISEPIHSNKSRIISVTKQVMQANHTPEKIISQFRNTAKSSDGAAVVVITILVALVTLLGIYFLFRALGLTINLKKFLLGFLLLTLLVGMMVIAG